MDINNYAENLMESILESYDSVVLEGFKKEKKDKEMRLAKTEFLNYLSTVHPDFDKKEITNAKTREQQLKVAKKYANDYEKWEKMYKRNNALAIGYVAGAIATMFGITAAALPTIGCLALFYWSIISSSIKIDKERKANEQPWNVKK